MSIADDVAPELIDTILDFLYDDKPSLLSCSLVARKWVPAPRHHIFARIAIHHFFAGNRARRPFMNNASAFLDICRSPFCSIIPFIRNVLLNVDPDAGPSGPVPTMLTDLVEILVKAPLEKLQLVDHTLAVPRPLLLARMTPSFPDLHDFSYNVINRVVDDILPFVSGLTALRTLSIYSSSKGSARPPTFLPAVPYPVARFAHLRTLRIRLYPRQCEALLPSLTSESPQLETLDLNLFHCYHNGWGPVSALNAFFRGESARHLRDLTLRITYEDDDDDEVDEEMRVEAPSDGELDLSALTGLHTLRMTSHCVESACAALTSLPPATLRVFRFDYENWVYYDDAPCGCNGAQLHMFITTVQTPQLDALTLFDLRVPDYLDEEGMLWFRQQFGKWADDDRMQISNTQRELQVDTWENIWEEISGAV